MADMSRRAPNPSVRALHAAIEAHVERLIAALDEIDGDADLEPDLSQGTGSDHHYDQSFH